MTQSQSFPKCIAVFRCSKSNDGKPNLKRIKDELEVQGFHIVETFHPSGTIAIDHHVGILVIISSRKLKELAKVEKVILTAQEYLECYSDFEKQYLAQKAVDFILTMSCESSSWAIKDAWVAHDDMIARIKKDDPEMVNAYYGPKVALTLGFFVFYTEQLTMPAAASLSLGLYCYFIAPTATAYYCSGFTMSFFILMCIWNTTFLELWKRQCSVLTYCWGLFEWDKDFEREELANSSGRMKTEKILDRIRWLAILLFICLFQTGVSIRVNLLRDFVGDNGDVSIYYGSMLVYCCFQMVVGWLLKQLTVWVISIQSGLSPQEERDTYALTLFVLSFNNRFSALFYEAFYEGDLQDLQVLIYFSYCTHLLQKIVLPNMLLTVRGTISLSRKPDYQTGANEKLSKEMDRQAAYNVLDDFIMLLTEYGLISMFIFVFPMGPAISYVTVKLLAIPGIIHKLSVCRKPEFKIWSDIGILQSFFEFISFLSILTNCYVLTLVFSKHPLMVSYVLDLFPQLSSSLMSKQTGEFLCIVVLEHVLIILKLGMSLVIKDTPRWVEELQAADRRASTKEVQGTSAAAAEFESTRQKSTSAPASTRARAERERSPSQTGEKSCPSKQPSPHMHGRRGTAAEAANKLQSQYKSIYGCQPIYIFGLILLPILLYYFSSGSVVLPLLCIPTTSVCLIIWQNQQDLADRAAASGLVGGTADSSLSKLLHTALPNWIRDPSCEKVDWLNEVLDFLFPYISKVVKKEVMNAVQPILDSIAPDYLHESLVLDEVDLGRVAPKIVGIRAYNVVQKKIQLDLDIHWAGSPKVSIDVLDVQELAKKQKDQKIKRNEEKRRAAKIGLAGEEEGDLHDQDRSTTRSSAAAKLKEGVEGEKKTKTEPLSTWCVMFCVRMLLAFLRATVVPLQLTELILRAKIRLEIDDFSNQFPCFGKIKISFMEEPMVDVSLSVPFFGKRGSTSGDFISNSGSEASGGALDETNEYDRKLDLLKCGGVLMGLSSVVKLAIRTAVKPYLFPKALEVVLATDEQKTLPHGILDISLAKVINLEKLGHDAYEVYVEIGTGKKTMKSNASHVLFKQAIWNENFQLKVFAQDEHIMFNIFFRPLHSALSQSLDKVFDGVSSFLPVGGTPEVKKDLHLLEYRATLHLSDVDHCHTASEVHLQMAVTAPEGSSDRGLAPEGTNFPDDACLVVSYSYSQIDIGSRKTELGSPAGGQGQAYFDSDYESGETNVVSLGNGVSTFLDNPALFSPLASHKHTLQSKGNDTTVGLLIVNSIRIKDLNLTRISSTFQYLKRNMGLGLDIKDLPHMKVYFTVGKNTQKTLLRYSTRSSEIVSEDRLEFVLNPKDIVVLNISVYAEAHSYLAKTMKKIGSIVPGKRGAKTNPDDEREGFRYLIGTLAISLDGITHNGNNTIDKLHALNVELSDVKHESECFVGFKMKWHSSSKSQVYH